MLAILLALHFEVKSVAEEASGTSEWQEDLSYLIEALEARHIDLYHTISAQDFEAEMERLRDVGEALSPQQRRVALMHLLRRVGDGHTGAPLWSDSIHRFPFEVSLIDGAAIVTGTTDSYRDLLGAELVRLNQFSVAEIKSKLEQIVPFVENQHSLRVRTGLYFLVEDLLVGLGYVQADAPIELTFRQGQDLLMVEASAIDQVTYEKEVVHRLLPRKPELYFERHPSVASSLWFGEREDGKTIYIQFDRYPSFEDMQRFGEALLTHMRHRGSEHVIIDLRRNFGGDFFVGLTLASYLNLADSVDWEDGVYVLIGNRTFSAAMSNAAQFRQILNARLVGAPTGARPCGFQDMGQFELPNSSLIVTYSKRRFCFVDTAHDSVLPDHSIELEESDYLGSSDRVLDWVLEDISRDQSDD